MRITRLAPSPTGALHLGNARTFLANWLLARQRGWKVILRIEDIDGPRIKRGADRQAIDDLRWLGMDWDEGPVYQSARLAIYRSAVERLLSSGHAYPCICSRSEVALAASAPHAEDGATIYPGTCRGRFETVHEATQAGRAPAIRFAVADQVLKFNDQFAGQQQFDLQKQIGDFVIAKADGTPAYQLAVVLDDAEAGVTDVVRGDDLIDSTPRQILLYRALGLEGKVPHYHHLPLIVGPDGRRLAKRHGDTRLEHYRQAGVSSGRVLSLMARWMGIERPGGELDLTSLLAAFELTRLPRQPVVLSAEDDRFLRT